MSKAVDDYLKKQKSPQREICRKLHETILTAYPNIDVKIWAGVPWYGMRYYIAAFEDHVKMGFPILGLSKKELALFEGSGKTMRHVKISSIKDIQKSQIIRLLKISEKAACLSCP